MSAQCPHYICPHNISLVRHTSFVRCCADIVQKLCGHISQGIYVRTMSPLYPSSVFISADWVTGDSQTIERFTNP